jgi:glycosyltransferase involved in cell wall biosynthesis
MKVALVHDYLNQYGGAERVLEAFCEMFPHAPIYTLVYDAKLTGFAFEGRNIKTSFLQKMPFAASRHRYFPVFMPHAIEQFDLSGYDLVLSDSGSYAKGVITKPDTAHISYCHTPHRYVWDNSHKLIEEFRYPRVVKALSPLFMTYVRIWDAQAAERPDAFIANSEFIAKRIKKYYGREAEVIYPPLNTERFGIGKKGDYFLMAGRMVPYKKFDIAIEAFNRLGMRLKIIGDGPERKKLERKSRSNVEFLGLVSEPYLADYYSRAQALIFPQEEDFGVVAGEAMASGTPVIAFRAGGALEIIKENEDGIFFDRQTSDSLVDAIGRFQNMKFDPFLIREHAMRFDKARFKHEIENFISQYL